MDKIHISLYKMQTTDYRIKAFMYMANNKNSGGNIMELVKKEVNFHNDKVFTVMKDGKLYVGASNICNNLGMTLGMKNRQVQNLQNDLVLSRGCIKFGAGVFDDNNQTLAIEIEFLPIWLAKIRITQNMLDEKQELVEKLIDYQLHCKDILADEFFGKREMVLPGKDDTRVNPHLNDIDDRSLIIRGIEAELTKLYDELVYHYNWIKNRSETKRDEYIGNIKKAKQKHFLFS